MKFILHLSLSIVGSFCISTGCSQERKLEPEKQLDLNKKEGTIRKITWRLSEQKSVVTPEQILDNQFIPIGDKEPNGIIIEDSKNRHNGKVVYKFICTGKANRIELSSTFGTRENLKQYSYL